MSQRHWSDSFGRSTFGLAIWTDRERLGDLSGAPGGRHYLMYSGSSRWKLYADGGWEVYDNYTWSDAPQAGDRIYGWATLRFLCVMNGIEPPKRRMKGEPFVPDTELLVGLVLGDLAQGASQEFADHTRPCGHHRYDDWAPVPIGEMNEEAALFWRDMAEAHEAARLPIGGWATE